jgi:branched-chain amino acid transport system substrate-binding protein
MFKKSLLGVLLVGAVFMLSACSEEPATDWESSLKGQTYRIGVITSLTGPTAAFGQEQKRILDYHVQQLNQKNKFRIELVYKDGQCDVARAGEAMTSLIKDEKIKFVIGGLCSTATFAAAPLTKNNEALLLTATTPIGTLEDFAPRVMSLSYRDDLVAESTAAELAKYKKIATLSEDKDDSFQLEKSVDDLIFAKYPDSKLVYDEKFEREKTDFTKELNQIRKSGAEVLWINPSSETSALALLRDLDKEDWQIPLLGQFAYDNETLLREAPLVANKLKLIVAPTIADESFKDYRQKIIVATGPLENLDLYYTASTVDALDILTKLISENGGDFASVQNALNTGTFKGHIGRIYFGGKAFPQDLQARKLQVENLKLVKATD